VSVPTSGIFRQKKCHRKKNILKNILEKTKRIVLKEFVDYKSMIFVDCLVEKILNMRNRYSR
jgi:hypothetical protein